MNIRKRNRFILGDTVAVILCPMPKGGSSLSVLIDKSDLEAVLSAGHWRARCHRSTGFYALASDSTGMHSFLLGVKGVDHINRRGSDNRRSNLRCATPAQNRANSRPTSGPFKGVTFHRKSGKYQAQIQCRRKTFYLGLFPDPKDAAQAYDRKAAEVFGEFAYLNFPDTAGAAVEKAEGSAP